MPKNKVRDQPKIPDHEVLRQIGGGAYGEVWLAQGVTGAMRAAKVVHSDDFDNEREFEREFQGILKYEPISRDHPSLVHILHVGRSEGEVPFYYYVMELGDDVVTGREINPVEYEARTLRSDMRIAEGDPLDLDLCIAVGRSLSEGLAHLHGNGLAHRDVKPANIIFVDGKAKLADIGLVALRGQRTFVGTEGFVPPEGPGSAQADVYSLGKVLYEMATGKDRLEFPELPDELPEGKVLKRWRVLNGLICDICEPRISKRRIKTATVLAEEFTLLQLGKRRSFEVKPVWNLVILCLALVVTGGWNFAMMSPWVVLSGEDDATPFVAPPVEFGLVTITSAPLGADVYSEEGALLGQSPFRLGRMPVDSWVSFEFRLRGYQTVTEGGMVAKGGLVIGPELKVDAPPQPGENWKDVLGMVYRPDEATHISLYYVGEEEWVQFQADSKQKGKGVKFVKISQNGRKSSVVIANQGEARQFTQWLMEKCLGEGYLNPDQRMEPRLDKSSAVREQFPNGLPGGLAPFRCAVLPGARILVTSEPIGADVYIGGVLRGQTPLVEEAGQHGVPVAAGKVEISLEADGFKTVKKTFNLKSNDVWSEPEHFVMEPNMGVVFGQAWENSLGMKFEPVGFDLMVGIWEVRMIDYMAYVNDRQTDVVAPHVPEFPQGDEHPVVNVSRQDAEGFCRWLTDVEHKRDRISKNHEYRLPTDVEWSAMAGLEEELGDFPQEREEGEAMGFPWGGGWPPLAGTANLADEAAQDLAIQNMIPNYHDGYAYTSPVGSFSANNLKLYDLSGNVYEWVADDYNLSVIVHNVVRGGGWKSFRDANLMTSARLPFRPGEQNDSTGFRVVIAKVPEKVEGGDPEKSPETGE